MSFITDIPCLTGRWEFHDLQVQNLVKIHVFKKMTLDLFPKDCWMVVSNIFYFHPYLGKIPILTNIFQMGWNHQSDWDLFFLRFFFWLVGLVNWRENGPSPMKIHPLCRSWVFPKKNPAPNGPWPVLKILKQKSLICIVFSCFFVAKTMFWCLAFVAKLNLYCLFLCYCFALVSNG